MTEATIPPELDAGRDRLWAAAAVVLALVFCWFWAGPIAFDPSSVGWLKRGDVATNSLGWWFFEQSPWAVPPGANPGYGLELGNTIAYSDSLPLFALAFKLFAPWLPQPFQYWGLWYLLSFALQGFFAYRIARAFDATPPLAAAAALFCATAPVFLFRAEAHLALSGHWSILAALYLNLRREPPSRWTWPLFLGLVAAIHFYLLAICAALGLASLASRLLTRELSWTRAAAETALGLVAMGGVLWAVGIFGVRSIGAGGYGYYRTNLLGFIDPSGWSRLLPDIPEGGGDYEGFAYLGLGTLLLVLCAALPLARRVPALLTRRWLPLVVVIAAFSLFAISQNIAIGPFDILTIPLPDVLLTVASVLRSGGRLIWPLLYLVTILAVIAGGGMFGRAGPLVAVLLLALQLVDGAPRWMAFRLPGPPRTTWTTSLTHPLWQALAPHYQRLRHVPARNQPAGYEDLAYYALTHDMATDAIYAARIDSGRTEALVKTQEAALATGTPEAGTLYILTPEAAALAAPQITAADIFAQIDGHIVFAPGGAIYAAGLDLGPRYQPK